MSIRERYHCHYGAWNSHLILNIIVMKSLIGYKKYWSNRHVEEGIKPIAERLDGWVEDALEDIKNGK